MEDFSDKTYYFAQMQSEHAKGIAAIQEAVYPTPYHEDIRFVMQRSLLFPIGSWVVIRKQKSSISIEKNNDKSNYQINDKELDIHFDSTNLLSITNDDIHANKQEICAGNEIGDIIGYMAAYPWPCKEALEKPPSLGDKRTEELIKQGAQNPSLSVFFIHEVTLYAQGEGIGKVAMNFLLQIGKKMGFKQAMLVAVLGNEDYWNKSNGFKEWKKLPDGYYKQDNDKVEKEIDLGQKDGSNFQYTNQQKEEIEKEVVKEEFFVSPSIQKQILEKRKSFFSTDWRVTIMTMSI
jgi:hypothetical protein